MNDNKKIAFNSVIIFVRLCLSTLISLIAARFVLQALGASDYGLYSVVGGMVTILNVVNTAMVSTTYRYIACELGKGETGQPNKVFNASFLIHACFALLIVILGVTIGEWYINTYLNVADGKLPDAKFVFRISILTTVVSTVLVPYRGLLVAFEKFSVSAIIDIVAQLFRLGGVIALLYVGGNKFRIYSLVMMAYIFIECAGYVLYSYRHYVKIIAVRFYRDLGLYKEMLSFSWWILFGAVASAGKTQGSAMIINFFFGTLVNGAFAVARQVENFIQMFARSLNNAAIPQITKNFSGGNESRSIKLASYISKYTFILMTLVAFPVMLEMDFLLKLWLKNVPEGAVIFCKLMVLEGLIGCMGEGIPALIQASGKIKYFQLVLSTMSILGLPIAFVFYKLGYNPYTISVIYCIIGLMVAIVRLYLLKWVLHMNIRYFIKTSYFRMFLISCPLALFFLFYNPAFFTVWQHIFGLISAECFLVVVILLLGFDRNEKNIINGYWVSFITKYLCAR